MDPLEGQGVAGGGERRGGRRRPRVAAYGTFTHPVERSWVERGSTVRLSDVPHGAAEAEKK